jgi:hypothetical protein
MRAPWRSEAAAFQWVVWAGLVAVAVIVVAVVVRALT